MPDIAFRTTKYMKLLSDPLFQALFNSPVPRIIVKTDAPSFTIVANNDAHKIATNLVGKDISGKSAWDVFNPTVAGSDGGELLMQALNEAQQTKQTVLMPPFRYDILSFDDRKMDVKWWQLEIMPVGNTNNSPEYLLATTYDITERMLKQVAIEEAQRKQQVLNDDFTVMNEELTATIEELRISQEELGTSNNTLEVQVEFRTRQLALSEVKFRSLVEQSPVAIALLKGPEHVVDSVNLAMLKLWDKTRSIVGKPIMDALPEMEGQPYPQILHDVLNSGVPFYANEAEVVLFRNNVSEKGYYNFINLPIKDAEGKVDSIIVVANEVTQQVLSRRKIEESESNLQTLILKARYGLMILRGRDFVVEIANHGIAEMWAKPLSEITGRKLLDVLPGLEGPPFPDLLIKVFDTGISYGQEEEVFYLNTPKGVIQKYVSFYYDPIFDDDKQVSGIIVTAHDISDFVTARKELERVYEQASLSKEAAQLGLFDLDLVKGTMIWDNRCRELFGISHDNEVSYDHDFLPGLHEDDRERITTVIDNLYTKKISNGDYDVEYRTIGAQDGKLRWVRAKGKVFFNTEDAPIRFIGSVLDITDKKREEQRKNDFIGMVSHELKTPITSLKAYIQMLYRTASKEEDRATIAALGQADKQVKKMTNMINGFLNISRLESGNLHLTINEFDINQLILEVIEDLKLIANTHTITFKNTEILNLKGDEEKIGHVISNIVSNAIKYSGNESVIEITTRKDGNDVVVCVKDNGIGISENDLDKLFGRYYRVEGLDKKFISGFGIGLYLSAEIIKLHKGKIWAESKNGEGASFFFSIPF
ncbi:MAG: hypothetical protein JWQ25_227 [Daejeonella sp.]|nr:hypothetical protein [Daejeonella sp.]